MYNLLETPHGKIFSEIKQVVEQTDIEAYVIGGYVRDLLLGKSSEDIDFVVNGSGIDFARNCAKKLNVRNVSVFKNYGTAAFTYKGVELEFVGARKESYNKESRNPIVENGSIEDDQKRRDFTINTLAISLMKDNFGAEVDPFNGVEDLHAGIIRTPLDPDITFSDDPLRMLRAIRFACRLNFCIEQTTLAAIVKNKQRMEIVSQERIVDELNKIMLTEKPSKGFLLLDKTGLLEIIFPQLSNLKGVEIIDGHGHKDNFIHTVQVLDNVAKKSNNLWLRWAALLHDIAKPTVKKYVNGAWTFHSHEFIGAKMIPAIFKSLKMPLNEKMKYVQKLVGMHHRAIPISNDEISDSAVRRLMYDAGQDLDDLMILCEADITSKIEEKKSRFLSNYQVVRTKIKELEQKDFVRTWQPPVDGIMIMETFGLKPCKIVGQIKDCIKNSILDGVIENSYSEAIKLMYKKGEEFGLKPISRHDKKI